MFDVQLEPTIVKPLIGRTRIEFIGVDTAGAMLPVIITKYAEITQIQVQRVTGTGSFIIEIYSDSSLTNKVFFAISDDTGEVLHFNKIGLYFENTDSPEKNNLCYFKIIPSSGIGHGFKVAVFFNKH